MLERSADTYLPRRRMKTRKSIKFVFSSEMACAHKFGIDSSPDSVSLESENSTGARKEIQIFVSDLICSNMLQKGACNPLRLMDHWNLNNKKGLKYCR